MNKETNFQEMTGAEIISTCGDNAVNWAAAFCQTAIKLGIGGIDESWMIGWFANAIEGAYQKRTQAN